MSLALIKPAILFLPGGIGLPEIIVILVIALLLFGAKRLPEMARGLGKGIKEFKGALKDTTDELKGSIEESDKKDTDSKQKNS